MNKTARHILIWSALALAGAATASLPASFAARHASTPSYSISAVGPSGGKYRPAAVNTSDQIVGTDGSGQPFFVDGGTVYHPTVPGTVSCERLTGLNDSGRIAGYVKLGPGCTGAVRAVTGVISGPDISLVPLEDTTGGLTGNCAALSVNNANEIAGVCDVAGHAREVYWVYVGGGYATPFTLSYPAHSIAPPSMGSYPPKMTRAIDQFGDIMGRARCAADHSTKITVLWTAAHHGYILKNLSSAGCHGPVSNATPVFGDGVSSNVTGPPGAESGPVMVAGSCRISGSGSSQKNTPCFWKMKYRAGSLVTAAPVRIDSSAGSKYARAVDVNASGWIIGYKGNKPDPSMLWVPHGTGHKAYTLTALASSVAWVANGPCDEYFGAAAMNAAANIVGLGENSDAGTGYLMVKAVGMLPHARAMSARHGVSGSGCQS